MRPGSLNTLIVECPVVNLSPNGRSAKGRWNGLRFQGNGLGGTRIQGGIYENQFVFTDGGWKISLLHYYPLYAGPYIGGWRNVGGNLSIVPYHFTPDEVGIPIPTPVGDAPDADVGVEELAIRIARLGDEDAVRNLQDAYGFYVDRKIWTDVVDLFVPDNSSIEIHDTSGAGKEGIRKVLEQSMGPENLAEGMLNEHLQVDMLVDVNEDRETAETRGVEIGMLGDAKKGTAGWEFNVFRNSFVKGNDGVWKIKEMRITPLIVANYSTGWGNGSLLPHPADVPEFLPGPRRNSKLYSKNNTIAAANLNTTQLEISLNKSAAFDAVENLASAYGYYADDLQGVPLGTIHAVNGHKEVPFSGFYLGRERIIGAMGQEYGFPNMSSLRSGISFHWLMQPVVLVADDGRSATFRGRLLQPSTSSKQAGDFEGGIYHNQFAIENGIWKIWSTTIDEMYWSSKDWASGWSGVVPRNNSNTTQAPSGLSKNYPPDLSLVDLGSPREDGFLGGSGKLVQWPGIQRMWFGYRNLVTGRVPESYWPGCVPCGKEPGWNLTRNGYLEPPTGP